MHHNFNTEKLPSNKKFGTFFSILFLVIATYSNYKNNTHHIPTIALGLSLTFLIVTLTIPKALTMPNLLWYKLGITLGKIVNPIVLGFIFFLLITPVALIARILGRDELKIKKRIVSTYWIERLPSGPEPESFKNQF
jgi:hypothetical protein